MRLLYKEPLVEIVGINVQELRLFGAALNEVLNGIGSAEFETRLGVSEAIAAETLSKINLIIDKFSDEDVV